MLNIFTIFLVLSFASSAYSIELVDSSGSAKDLLQTKLSGDSIPLDTTPLVEDIIASGQLGGPLFPSVPTSVAFSPSNNNGNGSNDFSTQNFLFAQAMNAWNDHHYDDAVQLMGEYVTAYPKGVWTAEAVLHQGCEARFNGRYTEANSLFNRVIDQYQDSDFVGARLVADKALSRQAVLEVMRNQPTQALELFTKLSKEALDWRLRTYASNWIRGLSGFRKNNLALADCGTQALAQVLQIKGRSDAIASVLSNKPKSISGFSLQELKMMAASVDLKVAAIELDNIDQLQKVPLPAIAQVKSGNDYGHYWLVESAKADQVILYDAQAKRRFIQTNDEFSKEWQKKLLVFTDEVEVGRILDQTEAQSVFGACCGLQRPEAGLGPPDQLFGLPGGINSEAECSSSPCAMGEPIWEVNPLTLNFYMSDIPLWYEPAYGPSVAIRLAYNSQSAISFRNDVGNKWQLNYGSYLVVDPGTGVTIFMPSGRRDVFIENGSSYDPPTNSNLILVKVDPTTYQLKWRDGSTWEYTSPAGTQQVYLTKITDIYGHDLQFEYAADHITRILDAENKITTFTYSAADKITSITGPYGRSANMTYNTEGDLLSIQDMGAYTTQFEYDSDKYVSKITTGHGTWNIYTEPADGINNAFDKYPAPGNPMWENYRVTITNPDDRKEEYYWDGFSADSWYVSPDHYIDYISSSNNNRSINVPKIEYDSVIVNGQTRLEYISLPEAGKTNYSYDSQGRLSKYEPPNNLDETYEWDIDNNLKKVTLSTSKSVNYAYNAYGDITQVSNDYSTLDVNYDIQRNPTTIDDSRKGIFTYSYNTHGQITNHSAPSGADFSYIYNGDDQLDHISLNNISLYEYEYDSKKRLSKITDSASRIYRYAYDDLDRLVTFTYPDGNTKTYNYGNAPNVLTSFTDRAFQSWHYSYDSQRRLTGLLKPSGQTLGFDYANNGD